MKEELIDFAIDKLETLLIEQEFKDRKKGKTTYVKKTRAYKDLIKLIKEWEGLEIKSQCNEKQQAIEMIKNDIKVNSRCLNEDIGYNARRLLEMWLDYDRKLLELLEGELNEKKDV